MKRLIAAGAFLAGMAAGGYLTAVALEGHAQTAEVAAAIQSGIDAGLPAAWAWRVARCESGYQPGATNRRSGAAGLYQFMPGTWRNTPQGRAGLSPYDPWANAQAAAWLYRHAGPRPWVCR